MFSTDFIFRQQENLVDNQKSQAGFRPLRNKILLLLSHDMQQFEVDSLFCTSGPNVQVQAWFIKWLESTWLHRIKIGSMTMVRTQEISTAPAYHSGLQKPYLSNCVTSSPKWDNLPHGLSYPTTNVTMAPIKVMPKVTQVCLYEALILLLSHDMQQFEFEVDSLFCTAGPNVQVPKHGVSTSAG